MRKHSMVERGQRYLQKYPVSDRNEIWEVAALSPDSLQIQHARLVRVANRTDSKTLSCAVLNGKYGFSLATS